MKELTNQQSKVLYCIEEKLNQTGFPPTRLEICKKLGFKSPNSAETHLRALEKKGYISIQGGSSRGISIIRSKNQNNPIKNYYENNLIPVVGLVAAGSPTLADENIEKRIGVDTKFFNKPVDFFLRVKGLSMIEAGIHEDDLIAVHKTKEVKNGDLAIIRIDDEVTLKYFYKNQNQLELKPANKDFQTITIDLSKQHAEIEGLGVGLIRMH
tara:strand:+ start:4179 stop:4811 length:633 start_codon:yes stop_codon:yes gene_type:complete